jgi:hypothetical protein
LHHSLFSVGFTITLDDDPSPHHSPYGSPEGSGEAVSRFPSQPFLLIPVPQMLQPRARAQDKHSEWVYSRRHGISSSKYRDSGKEKVSSVSLKDKTTR